MLSPLLLEASTHPWRSIKITIKKQQMVNWLVSSGNDAEDFQVPSPKSPTPRKESIFKIATSPTQSPKLSKFLSPTQFIDGLESIIGDQRRGSLIPETADNNKIRIVLLGGGGTGKTTLFKQRKKIFGHGYNGM